MSNPVSRFLYNLLIEGIMQKPYNDFLEMRDLMDTVRFLLVVMVISTHHSLIQKKSFRFK